MLVLGFGLHAHDDVAIHLDESAIAVPAKTGVAGLGNDAFNGLIVESDIEDGIHHARHGDPGPGPAGYEERILGIAILRTHDLLGAGDGGGDLFFQLFRIAAVILIIVRADLSGQREPGTDGESDIGHFAKVRALASEEILHLLRAFGLVSAEVVYPLV